MTIAHLFTLFIIGSVPVVFAAVQPWVWALYGIFILAAFLSLFWSSAIRLALFDDIVINSALLLFFAATLFLCVPLPTLFLSFLSPFRLEILGISQTLLDSPERWQTLSYSPKIAFSWWTFLLLLYLFFVTVRNQLSRPGNLKRFVSVMLGVGLIEACYGLIQALVPTLGVLWVDYIQAYMGDARGTFINRNHFAGFIEMVSAITEKVSVERVEEDLIWPKRVVLSSFF